MVNPSTGAEQGHGAHDETNSQPRSCETSPSSSSLVPLLIEVFCFTTGRTAHAASQTDTSGLLQFSGLRERGLLAAVALPFLFWRAEDHRW